MYTQSNKKDDLTSFQIHQVSLLSFLTTSHFLICFIIVTHKTKERANKAEQIKYPAIQKHAHEKLG